MRRGFKPGVRFELRRRFWQAVRSGLGVSEAAAVAGVSRTWAKEVFAEAGGVNPVPVAEPLGRYLSFAEREEIQSLAASGMGVRAIAGRLGRDPSTLSRELRR